jgi:predicted DNA-binding antitoxin AbrB/MazE fold protein
MTLRAVFKDGVFRPEGPVNLPDDTKVDLEFRLPEGEVSEAGQISEGLAKIYAILGERYRSGHHDTAERHNEHQP